METISDNSFDDNQSNESSCMSSYSSDISEENEIPDELKDEARASKRKLDWEERFKRFEEMDQMSGADNLYDIRDEDQMTKFALEVNEADSPTENTSTVGDEKDFDKHLGDTIMQHTFSKKSDFEKDGTSCYFAEDDNSEDSDISSNEKKDNISSYPALHEIEDSSIKHLGQNNQPINNDSMLNLEKGLCTKCGAIIYLPQYSKASDFEVSENSMCVNCMIKETGHDDCRLQNCLTCYEFAVRCDKIEFYRDKLLKIRRKKALTEQSTARVINPISRIGPSDEILLHETSQMPMYSTLSYRQNEELGYDTDSSFGQSSISSGGSEPNLPNVFIARKRNICKLCKNLLVSTNTDSYRKRYSIPICYSCMENFELWKFWKPLERHRHCEKNECRSCMKIARFLEFQINRRKHHLQVRKVSMSDDEIFHEEPPENLSSIEMSDCVVNLGIRNMACPSSMNAHSSKERLYAQTKSIGSSNIPFEVLNENIACLSPASSNTSYANTRAIDDCSQDRKDSYSVDKRKIVPNFQPKQLNLSNSSLIERFQDHNIKCLKNLSPNKSHSSPNKVYSSPKLASSIKKSFLSPEKLYLPEEEYYKPMHRSSIKADEAETTNNSKNVQRTPRKRLMIGQNLTPSQRYDSHGDETQSVSSLETQPYTNITLHTSSTNDITPNGKLKKRFTLKRSTKRK